MKIFYPVYIKPDKGQSIYDLANEIAKNKKSKKIGDKVFLCLPDGRDIEIHGNTLEEIRDSISTQCKFTRF